MSPTPSYQLRFIVSPQVLPVSPSRLHPRIALTRPGGARVKVGGAVPLAEPELSFLCSDYAKETDKSHRYINVYIRAIGMRATSAIFDVPRLILATRISGVVAGRQLGSI